MFRRQSVPMRLRLREMSGFYYSLLSSWSILKHMYQCPKGQNGVVCDYIIQGVSL